MHRFRTFLLINQSYFEVVLKGFFKRILDLFFEAIAERNFHDRCITASMITKILANDVYV